MKFSKAMIAQFDAYRATVKEFELGVIPVHEFLVVHQMWNDTVRKFEEECSAASNYGAF